MYIYICTHICKFCLYTHVYVYVYMYEVIYRYTYTYIYIYSLAENMAQHACHGTACTICMAFAPDPDMFSYRVNRNRSVGRTVCKLSAGNEVWLELQVTILCMPTGLACIDKAPAGRVRSLALCLNFSPHGVATFGIIPQVLGFHAE